MNSANKIKIPRFHDLTLKNRGSEMIGKKSKIGMIGEIGDPISQLYFC